MIAFDLISYHGRAAWHAMLFAIFVVLLVKSTEAVVVGGCWTDANCADEFITPISGPLKPNDEYKITGPCPNFLSAVGPPNKVDVCTDTACSRLQKNVCYTGGPYRTVEVLQ